MPASRTTLRLDTGGFLREALHDPQRSSNPRAHRPDAMGWIGTDRQCRFPLKSSEATSVADLGEALSGFFDPDWYLSRYPDVAASGTEPMHHYVHYGAAEGRDPNRFFDSAWYLTHYPDVANSGQHPLLHYLQMGAAELRNPHPRFDAAYYVDQHPEAAANPLLYHLLFGIARGWLTEKPIAIRDYLPSNAEPPATPR